MKSELRPMRASASRAGLNGVETARAAAVKGGTTGTASRDSGVLAFTPANITASAIIITPSRIANHVGELVQNDEAA